MFGNALPRGVDDLECAPEGGTIENVLRCALHINSGKIIFISRLSRPAGRSKRYFHGSGRKGKLHLQRRFLRKHGAAGKLLLDASGLNPLSHLR